VNVIGDVLIDGDAVAAESAAVSVFDISFVRGYGCFEALRAYSGRPFRMAGHLDRLEASAATLRLPLPPRHSLDDWVTDRAAAGGDCVVRVIVSGGTDVRALGTNAKVVVFAEPIPDRPDTLQVMPVPAPWHAAGEPSELTGAKTLSYGPNVAASLSAKDAGFDDALLLDRSGVVLEGPTFSVGWVYGDRIETPGLALGILASITRGAMLEVADSLGFEAAEGVFALDRLLGADEIFAMSTVKEIVPVTTVGEHSVSPGPVTAQLAAGFARLVAVEVGATESGVA
jgi:branched-subunit amino acid aminotransferase/4-amino-4-deoxychorismate lyase